MSRTILVTGGMGFLGSHLIEYGLNHSDDSFIAVTLNHEAYLDKENERLEIKEADYLFTDECKSRKIDFIINCAYPRNLDGYMVADGLKYTEKVFKTAKEMNVEGIINISSQSVYSQTREEPATEDSPICLESSYAVGKYMCELLLNNICEDIPHTNIRMASLIGPGFNQRIINRLVIDAFINDEIEIYKNNQRFGFLYIDDAVFGIFTVLCNYKNWKDVYNLGTEEGYSLLDIAQNIQVVMKEECGKDIAIITKANEDILNTTLNTNRMKKEMNFEAKNDLKEMVKRIALDYKK